IEAPAVAKPAIGERVAGGLLPGRIGEALRRALGKVEEKAVAAIFDPLLPPDESLAMDDVADEEEPTDFRLPALDEDEEGLDGVHPGDRLPRVRPGGRGHDAPRARDAERTRSPTRLIRPHSPAVHPEGARQPERSLRPRSAEARRRHHPQTTPAGPVPAC